MGGWSPDFSRLGFVRVQKDGAYKTPRSPRNLSIVASSMDPKTQTKVSTPSSPHLFAAALGALGVFAVQSLPSHGASPTNKFTHLNKFGRLGT